MIRHQSRPGMYTVCIVYRLVLGLGDTTAAPLVTAPVAFFHQRKKLQRLLPLLLLLHRTHDGIVCIYADNVRGIAILWSRSVVVVSNDIIVVCAPNLPIAAFASRR